MREEYNFDELNPRKNPYIGRLEELIDEAILSVDDNFGIPNATQMAKYLSDRGVVIKDDKTIVELPCPIGSTLYRIDPYERSCSFHHNHRNNLYYCINDYKCRHLCDGKCDDRIEYKIYTIENASAMAILGNAHLFGTRVFLDKEDAERELEKKNAEACEEMLKEAVRLPRSYEGYRDYWDDEFEDEEED